MKRTYVIIAAYLTGLGSLFALFVWLNYTFIHSDGYIPEDRDVGAALPALAPDATGRYDDVFQSLDGPTDGMVGAAIEDVTSLDVSDGGMSDRATPVIPSERPLDGVTVGEGWDLTSWGGEISVDARAIVMAVDSKWGALVLSASGALPDRMRSVSLLLATEIPAHALYLITYDADGGRVGAVSLGDYMDDGDVEKAIAIPVSALGTTTDVTQIALQSAETGILRLSSVALSREHLSTLRAEHVVAPGATDTASVPVEPPVVVTPVAGRVVYGDGLGGGWRLSSWGALVNPAVPTFSYLGKLSVRVDTLREWGSVVFERAGHLDPESVRSLVFAIAGAGHDLTHVYVVFYGDGGAVLGSVRVSDHADTVNISTTRWVRVAVPLPRVADGEKLFSSFAIQSARANATLYLDAVELTDEVSGVGEDGSLADDATDSAPLVNLTGSAMGASPYIIEGGYGVGWEEDSWDALVGMDETITFGDMPSVKVAITDAWGAFSVRARESLVLSDYRYLELYMHGGTSGGQDLTIVVYDTAGDVLGSAPLDEGNDGSPLPSRLWEYYAFPIDRINPSGAPISVIALQGSEASDPFYVHGMRLTHVDREADE